MRCVSKTSKGVQCKKDAIENFPTCRIHHKSSDAIPFYSGNIEKETLKNRAYRRVIYTSANQQLVLMYIPHGSEIGVETHKDSDQFFRIEKGSGKAIVGLHSKKLGDGSVVIVPKGTRHNIIATDSDLSLYTIYSPPHHPPDRIDLHKV